MKFLNLARGSSPKRPIPRSVVPTQIQNSRTDPESCAVTTRIPTPFADRMDPEISAAATQTRSVAATQIPSANALETVSKLSVIQDKNRITGFAALPEAVRAEAKERMKFIQYIRERKMLEPKTPDPQVVMKVALDRVEEFPILRGSGQHGKSQLTYQNYRNWTRRIREYRNDRGNGGGEGDLLALATTYRRGSIYDTSDNLPSYGDRQFWTDFNAAYLNQNKLDLTTAREIAVFALRRRSSTAVAPSISQVRNYVRHLPLSILIAGREGEVAWRNTICDYINREWHETEPGELLIGDSRDFDTRVRVEKNGEWIAVRPTIAVLMDARSWVPASWTITVNPVNADTLCRTLLQYICENNGQVPAMCYFDNGKDYCKQGFSTPLKVGTYEHSIFKELGIVLTNAKPFNARAKTVERFFRDMMKSFDKIFPDYLGSNPLERPDSASYFDKKENVMELPTLDSFTRIFTDWCRSYISKPKGGIIHQGRSPLEIWESRSSGARVLSPLEVAFGFLLPVGIRRVLRGPAVNFMNRRYFSDEVNVGETVLIKANLWDPEMVLLCRADGSAIAIARTRTAVRAIAGDDAAQNVILQEQLKRQERQRRTMRDQLSNLTGGRQGISVIEFMLSLGTDLRFIKRGSMTTIKGKSHTFKRIAPNENVFDPPALPESVRNEPLPEYDFTGETDKVSPVEMDEDIDMILKAETGTEKEQEQEELSPSDWSDMTSEDKKREESQGEIDDEDL